MKLIPYLFVWLILGQSFAAIAEDDVYPPDIARIIDSNTLRVALYYRDIPPFFMQDEQGRLTGYDVELAKGIAEELGVELEFNRTAKTFNGIVDVVARKDADMAISLLSRNLTRARKVLFSDPYVVLHPTLILNRLNAARYNFSGDDPIAPIRGMRKLIGEPKGNSYINIAQELFPASEVIEYEDWTQTINAVYQGDVFAVLRDEIGVKNLILENRSLALKLKIVVLDDISDNISIALPADSVHLRNWVNLYLQQKSPAVTADFLLHRYASIYEKVSP